MSGTEFSEELLVFVVQHLQSVQQFELLLFLRASGPNKITAADAGREIRTSERCAAAWLKELTESGLLQASGHGTDRRFVYAPTDPHLTNCVDALATEYRVRKWKVIDLICSRPKIRAVLFAGAFRIKKEGDDG